MSQSSILAETVDLSRGLVKWYLSFLKEVDMKQPIKINNEEFNSPLWIAAHVAWAENFLVLQSTGGKALQIDWLEHSLLFRVFAPSNEGGCGHSERLMM